MSAGKVVSISGEAYTMRDGIRVDLQQNDPVFQADILFTGDNAKLEIKFNDDSVIDMGPKTEVNVQDFVFTDESESFVVRLVTGVMQSASGKIVERNPDAFSIRTPLGTVGIRGTETIHIVNESGETHAIIDIADNHTVIISNLAGQSTVLSSNLEAAQLSLGQSPQKFTLSPDVMQNLVEQIFNSQTPEDIMAAFEQAVSREVKENVDFTVETADSIVQSAISVLGETKSVTISTELSFNELVESLDSLQDTALDNLVSTINQGQVVQEAKQIISSDIDNLPKNFIYSSGPATFIGGKSIDTVSLQSSLNIYADIDGFHAGSTPANADKVTLVSIENVIGNSSSNLFVGGILDPAYAKYTLGQAFGASIYQNFGTVTGANSQTLDFASLGGLFSSSYNASGFAGGTLSNALEGYNNNYNGFGVYDLNFSTVLGVNPISGELYDGSFGANFINVKSVLNQGSANNVLVADNPSVNFLVEVNQDGSLKVNGIDYYDFQNVRGVDVTASPSLNNSLQFGASNDVINVNIVNSSIASPYTAQINNINFDNFAFINSGEGNDHFIVNSNFTGPSPLYFNFAGQGGNDRFDISGAADMYLEGGAGNDIFNINLSARSALYIQGGDGDDIVSFSNSFFDTSIINGGNGYDTLDMQAQSFSLNLSLNMLEALGSRMSISDFEAYKTGGKITLDSGSTYQLGTKFDLDCSSIKLNTVPSGAFTNLDTDLNAIYCTVSANGFLQLAYNDNDPSTRASVFEMIGWTVPDDVADAAAYAASLYTTGKITF